jgi:hypothetical protein
MMINAHIKKMLRPVRDDFGLRSPAGTEFHVNAGKYM